MTSVKKYRKLVRDRIPEIITKSGKTCTYEILDNENYIKMLDAKLQEELNEYQESKSLEELADLLEVMGAVVKARGFSWEELTTVRKEKRAKRGGFDKKILLVEVQETPSNSAAPPKQNDIQQVASKPGPENAGKPWTKADDEKLCRMFEEKASAQSICSYFKRTEGAIAARLVRLGKIQEREEFREKLR